MGTIKIHRGNDAPLRLLVVRGDGVLEDYAGVSELSVQLVKNGARWVTVEPTAPIVAVNSGVNVVLPTDTPVGNYRAILKYRRGDRRYLAENCHAIEVIECVEDATTDDGVSVDVTLRVQFSADGKDGLSAYELAVLNGYTGTYEEWAEQLIAKPFFNLTLRVAKTEETNLLCAEVAGGDVKNGNDYRLRLMRRRKRGRDGRAGWGAVDPDCRKGANDSSPDWVRELNKVYTEFYLYDFTYEDDDGNSVTIENVLRDIKEDINDVPPGDIAMCFMAYKNETVEVYSGYKNKRVIGSGPTRVDMQNLGLAIYRYEGDKAVERVSNIAPLGITIIGSYDPNNSIYDKIEFYWNVSENGSRVNPRKLLAFPKPETE